MRRLSTHLLTSLVVSALVLNPLAVTLARAEEPGPMTFAERVANRKEANSILLKAEDLAEAELHFPKENEALRDSLLTAFSAFAKSMDMKDGEPETNACEPLVLSRLQSEFAARGLPADPTSIRLGLLILRKLGRIDDVALLPLLAAYPAWANLGYAEKDWIKRDAEGRTAIVDCPTEHYLQLVGAVQAAEGRKMKRKDIRKRIAGLTKEKNDKDAPRYLAVQLAWLRALEESRYEKETFFALGHVLKQVADAKNSSPRSDPNDKPTKVMSKKKAKTGGLSNRLALYAKYNSLQINLLADEFKKFTERMDILSAEAKIVISYKDGREDEVYTLTQQEQYRMAAKMLHKEVEELKLSGLFTGKSPTFDDVIVASVETGFIHATELDAALGVDDLWNPKVSGWTKVMTIVKKYGTTALILIPTPWTFWASLAITLAETLVKKKTQGPGEADDHGISIF